MQVPFDHVQGRLSTPCAVLHPIDEDLSMGAPEAEDDDCGGPTV